MRSARARLLLAALAAAVLLAGPTSARAVADDAQLPVLTSVTYGNYTSPDPSLRADTATVDWGTIAPDHRLFCSVLGCSIREVQLDTFASTWSDTGTPRSRISYRTGVCDRTCVGTGPISYVFGPWVHPAVPAGVNGSAPSLTATPGTRTSPGMKITVSPGAQAGAPVFLIYNGGGVVGRVGPGNLTFVDVSPRFPLNSYSVAACYADCMQPDWPYWGDGFKAVSAHSAVVKAYTANTTQCKTLGRMLYAFGKDWRPACKP